MTYVNAPIHDLLIRIKNAYMARKTSVESIPFSNFKVKILELLKQYGFIQNFEIKEKEEKKSIHVTIRITPKMSKWLKDKEYSPTGIFYEAVRDLGYGEEYDE